MSFEQVEIIRLSPDRQRLLRKVLRAATRCHKPTTANIAALAGIGEDLCRDVLIVAQHLGLAEYEPQQV